jgi:Flp pilus assembly protein TadD
MIGYCLMRKGDRAGAIEAFRTTVRCKPNFSDAHRYLGELLTREGQLSEAFVHLSHALNLNPRDGQARNALDALVRQISSQLADSLLRAG